MKIPDVAISRWVLRNRRIMGLVCWGAFCLSSCLGPAALSPQIEGLSNAQQYEKALQLLDSQKGGYGKNNKLQFLLDRGLLLHLSKKYQESIVTFAAARQLADELYTKSVSKQATTWITNEYAAPYPGEDFERALVNVFQALNYALLNKREDALVEARDVDSLLAVINDQYAVDQKNVYKEDAFIRLFMGILYEASGTSLDTNDAYVSYRKALEVYDRDYKDNYDVNAPRVLQSNILRVSREIVLGDFDGYRDKFRDIPFASKKERQQQAEVYLIQYNGLAPIKEESQITLPMLDGYLVKVAFPKYRSRPYATATSRLVAGESAGTVLFSDSELVEPIGRIAEKNLERRKLRFIAKATIRATSRYMIEKNQEKSIYKNSGSTSAAWFRFASSFFNIVIEKADVRCWQTLPDQIRLSHILLKPGTYTFTVENFGADGAQVSSKMLGERSVKAGDQIFLVVHTP